MMPLDIHKVYALEILEELCCAILLQVSRSTTDPVYQHCAGSTIFPEGSLKLMSITTHV